MNSAILDLALVMVIAAGFGMIARLLKQPLLLAYLFAGIVISALGFLHINDQQTFKTFSDLGIMFLLFLVGMEINYTSLRMVGKASLIVGFGQIALTFAVGFLLAILFNFSLISAAYISIALTFSSTIIIVKLLSDKRDINNLYGKISIGFLLVQDFIAILLLIFLSGIEQGNQLLAANLALTIFKAITLFIIMLVLGKTLLPAVLDIIGGSQELLFLASIAWVFLLVALVGQIGFSVEIGGLLAGLSLANSSEHFEIASRVRPLRDFFIVIFFVVLGSLAVSSHFSGLALPIIVFSLFVLIGNPLIVLCIMGAMGYRKRTSFFAAITVGQISEFSLIITALGLRLGHITQQDTSIIAATGVITITASTYMIMYTEKLFQILSPYLRLFERANPIERGVDPKTVSKPIILIGFHRTGRSIAANLSKEDLLVIDFDPESIERLRQQGFDFLFDDINDPEVLEQLNLRHTKLIISTSPELSINLGLLTILKKLKQKKSAKWRIITRARTEEELRILYTQGADYVLLPHFTAGWHLGKLVYSDPDGKILSTLKEKDLAMLTKEILTA